MSADHEKLSAATDAMGMVRREGGGDERKKTARDPKRESDKVE